MSGDERDDHGANGHRKRHTHPKPHNRTGTAQFNGLAVIFRVLSRVIPPKFFDVIFGAATVGGAGAVAYWLWTDVQANFPSEAFSIPEYVIPAFVAFAVGAVYLGLRRDSQCPQCGAVFSLRREEVELERDQHPEAPDELLVRRDASCAQCSYENGEKFWREESEQPELQ
ncbi:hypothetical protein [Halobacterium zhouii]|uniref:hypothetical protein n=1 Tax=Halobacterium zhouii TaxID=2902624 RepID=UPI001E3A1D83|nr:hypothetical protein [Halobacterium zhouii]